MATEYYTTTEVATKLNVANDTVLNWVRNNPDFPRPVRIGAAWRFAILEIDAFIAASRDTPTPR